MTDELIRRAEDLLARCERACVQTATAFLTPAEQAELRLWAERRGCRMLLRGGDAKALPEARAHAERVSELHEATCRAIRAGC